MKKLLTIIVGIALLGLFASTANAEPPRGIQSYPKAAHVAKAEQMHARAQAQARMNHGSPHGRSYGRSYGHGVISVYVPRTYCPYPHYLPSSYRSPHPRSLYQYYPSRYGFGYSSGLQLRIGF